MGLADHTDTSFLALGIAFFAISITLGNPGLSALGVAFIAIGVAHGQKKRKEPRNC